jgi:RHS repeat-associated protein
MHARYYSYNLGRFTSIDPVGGEVGLSQSWNRYAYVKGNPVNAVDPDARIDGLARVVSDI